MKSFTLPLAMLLAVASAPVSASEAHEHADKHACPMHDTTLTAEERTKAMDAMFVKLDADADGSISRAEFDRHHEDMRRGHEEKKHEH